MDARITLKEAVRFHGHLGPWLVLGLLLGEYALKKIKAKKYFKLQIRVSGAGRKPRSCMIDGLQLSTGATYGKGNIRKVWGAGVWASFHNLTNGKKIKIYLSKVLIKKLGELKTHRESESFARKLYKLKKFRSGKIWRFQA